MTEPGPNTSNYGRALYHLAKAEEITDWDGIKHAIMANARATLALIDLESPESEPVWDRECPF